MFGSAVELKQTAECVRYLIYMSWILVRTIEWRNEKSEINKSNRTTMKKNKNRNGNELLLVAVRSLHVFSVTFLTPFFFFNAVIKLNSSSFYVARTVCRTICVHETTPLPSLNWMAHRYEASCIFHSSIHTHQNYIVFRSLFDHIRASWRCAVIPFYLYLWPRAIACVMTSTNEMEYVCTSLFVHTNEIRLEYVNVQLRWSCACVSECCVHC